MHLKLAKSMDIWEFDDVPGSTPSCAVLRAMCIESELCTKETTIFLVIDHRS